MPQRFAREQRRAVVLQDVDERCGDRSRVASHEHPVAHPSDIHIRVGRERADILAFGQRHDLPELLFGEKIVVAHRLFRCPDLLAGAVFDRGLVDEDREQLVEGVAVAAGIAPQVEDDVGDALPFETDDRPAEDAHQAAVVGEKLRYGDVAAACIGVGADVGVGLLGLAQAEERVAVGESLGLDREGLAAALQVDAEALPEELEVVAEEQGRGLHVAVVVDVAEVFGGRYAVDGRDAVAAPEGGVERAVDQQRVLICNMLNAGMRIRRYARFLSPGVG